MSRTWRGLQSLSFARGIRKLKQFPNMGRPGREEGTRELLHKRLPHIVAYRVKDDSVEILHIWHSAQEGR